MQLNTLQVYLPCNVEILTNHGPKDIGIIEPYHDLIIGIELSADGLVEISEGILRDKTQTKCTDLTQLVQVTDISQTALYLSFALPQNNKEFYLATYEALLTKEHLVANLSAIRYNKDTYTFCIFPEYISQKQVSPVPFTKNEYKVTLYNNLPCKQAQEYTISGCTHLFELTISFSQITPDSVVLPLIRLEKQEFIAFGILSE